MVFSSALFLFAFFPVVFVLYHAMPGIKAKNAVLLLFSLVFYACGRLAYLPLLVLSILVNWGAGRLLGLPWPKTRRRLVAVLAVVFDLGLLGIFKYLDFFIVNLNSLLGTAIQPRNIPLPLGISFFTFTALSYVIEVFRKRENMAKNLWQTALYMALFPTILSGPIVSWKAAAPQLEQRVCSAEKTARGLRRFVVGMAKKLLIADTVGRMVDALFAAGFPDARAAWLGAVGYAVQILFDFDGYSDMAIGIGQVFGFSFPENFDRPYTALGMTDFWKRWHISLTAWFRNYLYMPLVMTKPLRRLYRKWTAKFGRAKANKFSILIPMTVVWFLTGLWHGAAWNYVLWGLWHGLCCALEGVGVVRTKGLEKTVHGRLILRCYTAAAVLFGTVLFRSGSMIQAGRMYAAMFTGWHFSAAGTLLLQRNVTGLALFSLILGLVLSLVRLPKAAKKLSEAAWVQPLSYIGCGALLVLCIMCMAQRGFQPFIYLQF